MKRSNISQFSQNTFHSPNPHPNELFPQTQRRFPAENPQVNPFENMSTNQRQSQAGPGERSTSPNDQNTRVVQQVQDIHLDTYYPVPIIKKQDQFFFQSQQYYDGQIRLLLNENYSLTQKLNQVLEEIKGLRNSNEESIKLATKWKIQVEQLQQRINELESIQLPVNNDGPKILELTEKIKQVVQAYNELKDKYDDQQKQLENPKQELEMEQGRPPSIKDLEELQEATPKQNDPVEEARREEVPNEDPSWLLLIQKQTMSQQQFMTQIDDVFRQNDNLRMALHNKDDEITTLKMTIKTFERKQEAPSFNQEYELLKQQYNDSLEWNKHQQFKYEVEIQSLQIKIQSLQCDLEQINGLKERINELQRECLEWKDKFYQINREYHLLQQKFIFVETELDNLRKKQNINIVQKGMTFQIEEEVQKIQTKLVNVISGNRSAF